jgi:hypothetical protein
LVLKTQYRPFESSLTDPFLRSFALNLCGFRVYVAVANLNAIGDKLALLYSGPNLTAVIPLANHAVRAGNGIGAATIPTTEPTDLGLFVEFSENLRNCATR